MFLAGACTNNGLLSEQSPVDLCGATDYFSVPQRPAGSGFSVEFDYNRGVSASGYTYGNITATLKIGGIFVTKRYSRSSEVQISLGSTNNRSASDPPLPIQL